MRNTKTILGVAIGSALLGMGAASAADMPVKAPYVKAPVAMVYDWTGFYIGVNAGVGVGRDYTRMDIPAGLSFERNYLNPEGGLGGGQIGYNWQTPNTFIGPIVFGVEADIQGTGMRDNNNCLIGCLPGLNLNYNQRLDWFGTVRGRVGLATGPVLSYVTAGWAYGSVKTTVTETIGAATGSFTSDQNRGGWVWGSGIEASLGGNWTGKIEGLYMDYGSVSGSPVLTTSNPQLRFGYTSDITDVVVRAGVNYHFGAPVVAKH